MKNIFYILAFAISVYFINANLIELAYKLGFAEVQKETVLEDRQNIKVKCHYYYWGFVDEIKIENKYQQCINQYQAKGYQVVSTKNT